MELSRGVDPVLAPEEVGRVVDVADADAGEQPPAEGLLDAAPARRGRPLELLAVEDLRACVWFVGGWVGAWTEVGGVNQPTAP